MKTLRSRGFTLLEQIIVIVIIGILATLGITQYQAYRENILDREARENLKMIRSAERIFAMETQGAYYPSLGNEADITVINANLKVDIRAGAQRNWDYSVFNTGCARATRFNGPDTRSWFLTTNDADGEPDPGAGCP